MRLDIKLARIAARLCAALCAAGLWLVLPLSGAQALSAGAGPGAHLEAELDNWQAQRDFFMEHWPELRAAIESGGAPAGVDWIDATFSDDLERRVMYAFANQGLYYGDWPGRNLDTYIAVADAGIAECLRQAEAAGAAGDEETRTARTNAANVLSYNLGADLAFCWGDEFARERRHFERGLKAGEDCIRWRKELSNPPRTLSTAHWLRGIHRMALEDFDGALADFAESLTYSEESARSNDEPTSLEAGNSSIVFAHGMLAIAKLAAGDETARAEYDQVRAIFAGHLASDDEDLKGDAEVYVPQYEEIEKRFGLGNQV